MPPDNLSTAELLTILAERARDWADNAAALGSSIDPASATRVAAQALVADRGLMERLEALEAGASEVMSRLQASVAEDGRRLTSEHMPSRRRRWGQGAQPSGDATSNPYRNDGREADQSELVRLTASRLLGLPAYDVDGALIGEIEGVVLAQGDGSPVSVKIGSR